MNKLHIGIRNTGGRNNRGRVTIRHRGGGHKRLYRTINHTAISGKILRIEYDPNRTAYLAECQNGTKTFYQILGENHLIGQTLKVVKLHEVGIGEEVYNVSLRSGQIGKIGRASGTSCKILKQGDKTTVIRMPSQQVKEINNQNQCIIGTVKSKPIERLGKAGKNRWKGIRPRVKGRAMNPIDHPNGGKTAGGGQSKTLWGKLAKWVRTRKHKG